MSKTHTQWDAFICHASEDKIIVRLLAEQLRALGLHVWFDESTLHVGDSLRRSIDYGLANSRFGIVILSHSFFLKEWPQRELDGLVALAIDSREKRILPVWHEIGRKDIVKYCPTLADLVAVSTKEGIDKAAFKLAEVIKPQSPDERALSKTDLIVGVWEWEPLKEVWPARDRWPTEWMDFENKSKAVQRILTNKLIELGYNPDDLPGSSEDITIVKYKNLPPRYFGELKEAIDTILMRYVKTVIWRENPHMGWNLIVYLGKDIGK